MKREYKDLMVTIHTKRSGKLSRCGYRYIITNGSTNHTAFKTAEGFRRWLNITGLKLGSSRKWLYNSRDLVGSYVDNMMLDGEGLDDKLTQELGWWLSNGDYTECRVSYTSPRVVSYLNPNCKNRATINRVCVPA